MTAPLVHLPLDETSGTVAADASGNNRPGTHFGGVAVGQDGLLAAGGKSAFYDGADDYTRIVSSEGNGNWSDTDYASVTARIKPNAGSLSGDQFIASSWSGSAPNCRWLLYVSNGKLTASVYTASGQTNATGTTVLGAGRKYSVGFAYNGATLRIFLNGRLEASVAKTGVLNRQTAVTTWPIELGRAAINSVTCSEVTVDDFRYYGVAIPDSEFADLHADAIAAEFPAAGLTGWYDASALGLADGALAAPWTDLSGNNVHATSQDSLSTPILKKSILPGRSKDVVRFDGTQDFMDSGALIGASTFTYVLLFRVTKPMVDFQVPFQPGNNSTAAVLLNSAGNRAIYAPGSWVDYSGTFYVRDTWERWVVTMNGSITRHYVNNALINEASATAAGSGIRIGAGKYTSNHSLPEFRTGGDFAEILTYDRVLTSQEIAAVDAYLVDKWLTAPLPSSNLYDSAAVQREAYRWDGSALVPVVWAGIS